MKLMIDTDGRPQPFIGVGGVVGADKQHELENISDELQVGQSGRKLVLSVNATSRAQLFENVESHSSPDRNWNPQNASELVGALDTEDRADDMTAMATVRFDSDYVSNPAYTDLFTGRVLQRATWADIIRFSGVSAEQLGSTYTEQLLAKTKSNEYGAQVAIDYTLPTLEQLQQEDALQTIVDQLAHYATVLDYIVLTTKNDSIQSARAVIERIYETPELDSVGVAVESQSSDKSTNTRLTRLLSDFPDDLSVLAEESLHVTPHDPTRAVDIEATLDYVRKALAAIKTGQQQQSELIDKLQNYEK